MIVAFSASLKVLLVCMLHMTGFDGVLGGVTGVVYSVAFDILSNFVIFTSDVIVGITTSGSN